MAAREAAGSVNFQGGLFLLLVAAVVAMLARRLRLPYSVALVGAGILLSLLPFWPEVPLTKELLFTALLPPLIFESAFHLHWKDLRKDLAVISVLATLGILVSAMITTVDMQSLVHWEWSAARIFGVSIAAAAPASVMSLVNDGTAPIGFAAAVDFPQGGMREARQAFPGAGLPAWRAIALAALGRAFAYIHVVCCSPTRGCASSRGVGTFCSGDGLALALPKQPPQREAIITVSFAVVAFSIFAQGLTIAPLLRRLTPPVRAGFPESPL